VVPYLKYWPISDRKGIHISKITRLQVSSLHQQWCRACHEGWGWDYPRDGRAQLLALEIVHTRREKNGVVHDELPQMVKRGAYIQLCGKVSRANGCSRM